MGEKGAIREPRRRERLAPSRACMWGRSGQLGPTTPWDSRWAVPVLDDRLHSCACTVVRAPLCAGRKHVLKSAGGSWYPVITVVEGPPEPAGDSRSLGYGGISPILLPLPARVLSPDSTNQRFPSGPAVMPSGKFAGIGNENSVMLPDVVIRPTKFPVRAVNQRLLSGPAAIPNGCLRGLHRPCR
jgi:hypothetical protein